MTFEFARGTTAAAPAPGPRLHVYGVDLSMTATGLSVIRPGTDYRLVRLIESSPNIPEGADPYPFLADRLQKIGKAIRSHAFTARQRGDLTLGVMEGPSLGVNNQKHRHTMSWLWGRTYEILLREGAVSVVPPTTLKSYVTGKGNSDKATMIHVATGWTFPGVDFTYRGKANDNLVDSYGLAAMGCRELGYPVEPSVQRCNPSALEAVRWHEPRPSRNDTKGITT
jgi:hypothetical protein